LDCGVLGFTSKKDRNQKMTRDNCELNDKNNFVEWHCPRCGKIFMDAPPFLLDAHTRECMEADLVNHPPHYTSHPSGVECIQITEHMSFTLGNAIKYIWRADLKNGTQDLEKAIWYLTRELEKRKR
jgi:hypothetical protein